MMFNSATGAFLGSIVDPVGYRSIDSLDRPLLSKGQSRGGSREWLYLWRGIGSAGATSPHCSFFVSCIGDLNEEPVRVFYMEPSVSIFVFLRCDPALNQVLRYRLFVEISHAECEMIHSTGVFAMP
jgi:hypothetical protein